MGDLHLDDDDDFSTGSISTKESGQGDYGLRIRGSRRDFFLEKSKLAVGLTQLPEERVSEVISLWLKRSKREANHSHQSNTDVKML
jgi:hypothetical protein